MMQSSGLMGAMLRITLVFSSLQNVHEVCTQPKRAAQVACMLVLGLMGLMGARLRMTLVFSSLQHVPNTLPTEAQPTSHHQGESSLAGWHLHGHTGSLTLQPHYMQARTVFCLQAVRSATHLTSSG